MFTGLFGIGLVLHSASIVFIWTPLYILAHVIELKKVEEPELELRFGGGVYRVQAKGADVHSQALASWELSRRVEDA